MIASITARPRGIEIATFSFKHSFDLFSWVSEISFFGFLWLDDFTAYILFI